MLFKPPDYMARTEKVRFMNNIAIITARSGSKGVKDKNIKMLNGKPLMAYTIEAAIKSGVFEEVMVSTDSEAYAGIAREYGAKVPFLRSDETSSDTAGSWDVIMEVLTQYDIRGKRFETLCLLQPTSPLRRAADIIGAYSFFDQKNADAVSSVCECEHPAEYMMTLDSDRSLESYRKNVIVCPRQNLPQYYRLNGAIYIRRIDYLDKIVINDKREYAYVMSINNSVDIDTDDDFKYAEWLMQRKL